jgi:hypothetical protein
MSSLDFRALQCGRSVILELLSGNPVASLHSKLFPLAFAVPCAAAGIGIKGGTEAPSDGGTWYSSKKKKKPIRGKTVANSSVHVFQFFSIFGSWFSALLLADHD